MADSIIVTLLAIVVCIGILLVSFSPMFIYAGALTAAQGGALMLTGLVFVASILIAI